MRAKEPSERYGRRYGMEFIKFAVMQIVENALTHTHTQSRCRSPPPFALSVQLSLTTWYKSQVHNKPVEFTNANSNLFENNWFARICNWNCISRAAIVLKINTTWTIPEMRNREHCLCNKYREKKRGHLSKANSLLVRMASTKVNRCKCHIHATACEFVDTQSQCRKCVRWQSFSNV